MSFINGITTGIQRFVIEPVKNFISSLVENIHHIKSSNVTLKSNNCKAEPEPTLEKLLGKLQTTQNEILGLLGKLRNEFSSLNSEYAIQAYKTGIIPLEKSQTEFQRRHEVVMNAINHVTQKVKNFDTTKESFPEMRNNIRDLFQLIGPSDNKRKSKIQELSNKILAIENDLLTKSIRPHYKADIQIKPAFGWISKIQ